MSSRIITNTAINPYALPLLPDQSESACIGAVLQDGLLLREIENQSELICQIAILNNPAAFVFVKHQSLNLCKTAVSMNGMLLEFVKEQTQDLCHIALIQNPLAIQFVEPRFLSEKLFLSVAYRNYRSFRFIPKKYLTKEICVAIAKNFLEEAKMKTIDHEIDVIDKIHRHCPEALLHLIDKYPLLIQWVTNPSEDLCLRAIAANYSACQYIQSPNSRVLQVMHELNPNRLSLDKYLFDMWRIEFDNDPCSIKKFLENMFRRVKLVRTMNDEEGMAKLNKTSEAMFQYVESVNPHAFKYIQDNMVMEGAIAKSINDKVLALDYSVVSEVNDLIPNDQLKHIRKHPTDIRFLTDQTERLCMTAAIVDPRSVIFIRDISLRLKIISYVRRVTIYH